MRIGERRGRVEDDCHVRKPSLARAGAGCAVSHHYARLPLLLKVLAAHAVRVFKPRLPQLRGVLAHRDVPVNHVMRPLRHELLRVLLAPSAVCKFEPGLPWLHALLACHSLPDQRAVLPLPICSAVPAHHCIESRRGPRFARMHVTRHAMRIRGACRAMRACRARRPRPRGLELWLCWSGSQEVVCKPLREALCSRQVLWQTDAVVDSSRQRG